MMSVNAEPFVVVDEDDEDDEGYELVLGEVTLLEIHGLCLAQYCRGISKK